MDNKEKILILDTSAIIYRAHFALTHFRNSSGQSTGATLGFLKQLKKSVDRFNPNYVFAVKDVKRKDLKRVELFEDYKSNRQSMPDELVSQLETIDTLIKAHGIPLIRKEGYEADDVIGTLVNKFSKDYEIIVVTGDKDLAQLIRPNVKIALLKSDDYKIIENDDDVMEFLGVTSSQITDLFGLMGDSSDGIPGVRGIGPKKGASLINTYGSLDGVYANIESVKGKLKQDLIDNKEMAYISKQLATIYQDLDIEVKPSDSKYGNLDIPTLEQIYIDYEFKSELENIRKYKGEKSLDQVDYKYVEYTNISDFVTAINEANTRVSLFKNDEAIGYFDGKTVHYSLDLENDKADLFTQSLGIEDISKDIDVILYSYKEWLNLGLTFNKYFDILLASFSLGTDRAKSIEDIILSLLYISVEAVDKKKKSKKTDMEEYIKSVINNISTILIGMYNLKDMLEKELKDGNKFEIYKEECEFTKVLKYVENQGIRIDIEYFESYSKEVFERLKKIESEIYEESGEKFNINSPKQLGEILFTKLEIEPVGKKGKTGYSTDAEVLELLKTRGIKIAGLLLEYRELSKLYSTYIEPLLKLEQNGKIHTTYNQTGTATGRLSSENPNLQNIPTRTEEGNKIRRGFVASEGKMLYSFDYSQIELRVLAALSGDENLVHAYENDLDLHDLTARRIFNLNDTDKVDKQQRNIAKIINFSVIYGKTSYGLSKELKISVQDAQEYINTYFKQYPKVREFLDNVIEFAKEHKYVETHYGTRRYIYTINDSNYNIREQSARMAMNTIIQGTAANIIKKVMSAIYDKLCNDKLKMLLQVHDELIFEVDKEYTDAEKDIRKVMEETIKFDNVKLVANCNIGKNWSDLK